MAPGPVGLRNESAEYGSAWAKNSDGDAIDESGTLVAENMSDLVPTAWRTTDATVANTMFHRTLDRTRAVQQAQLRGGNLSPEALVRVTRDPNWVQKWGIEPNADTTTMKAVSTNTLSTSADCTFAFWVRARAANVSGSGNIAYFGTAFGTSNYDWALYFNASSGVALLRVARYSGASVDASSSSAYTDDGRHLVAFTLEDSTTTAELWVDGVSVASNSSIAANDPTQTAEILNLDQNAAGYYGMGWGEAAMWNRKLTDAEIQGLMTAASFGSIATDLELHWRFDEGTGVALADSSVNSHTGTISGDYSWKLWTRPAGSAAYSSGICDYRGPARHRKSVVFDGLTQGARTPASLRVPRSWSAAFWLRLKGQPNTTAGTAFGIGTAVSSTEEECRLHVTWDSSTSAWKYRVRWRRYNGTNSSDSSEYYPGETLHRVLIATNGATDEGFFYIDGAQVGSTADLSTAPYVAKSSQRLSLGYAMAETNETACEIVGDVVLLERAITPAEDRPYGRFAPELDLGAYLHYSLREGTGSSADNRGSAGTDGDLVFTGSPTWGDVRHTELTTVAGVDTPVYLPTADAAEIAYEKWFIDSASTDCKHCLVEIVDPDNADGYIEIDYFGLWRCFEPSASYEYVTTMSRDGKSFTRQKTLAQVFGDDVMSWRVFGLRFPSLSAEEEAELDHFVGRRSAIDMRPITVSLQQTTDAEELAPRRTILGMVLSSSESQSFWANGTVRYSRELTVAEIPP